LGKSQGSVHRRVQIPRGAFGIWPHLGSCNGRGYYQCWVVLNFLKDLLGLGFRRVYKIRPSSFNLFLKYFSRDLEKVLKI
jgi:hypothetical protein